MPCSQSAKPLEHQAPAKRLPQDRGFAFGGCLPSAEEHGQSRITTWRASVQRVRRTRLPVAPTFIHMKPSDLYLDLLKKTLVFDLWDEPGMPVKLLPADKVGRKLNRSLSAGLERFGYQIVRLPKASRQQRDEGATWPGMAHSMVGMRRLDNIQQYVEKVLADGIRGDLIETGVWRGGLAFS